MKRRSHSLTNREIDSNGLVDKYEEFDNSDFSNEFIPLEKPDYEIRASQNNREEESMKGTRKASYVGELTSGYDAKVQDDYEAGKGDKGQEGKGHEEEVAAKNNWEDQKRDVVGRAAASQLLRKAAVKLNKMAEAMEQADEEAFDDTDEDETVTDLENVASVDNDEDDELEQIAAAVLGEMKTAATTENHPIEHDDKKDDPKADMSAQTGDDEWVDIGSADFNDKRDEVGRAAEGK